MPGLHIAALTILVCPSGADLRGIFVLPVFRCARCLVRRREEEATEKQSSRHPIAEQVDSCISVSVAPCSQCLALIHKNGSAIVVTGGTAQVVTN